MSSKWVEFRDAAVANLEIGKVDEALKQKICVWLSETFLPMAEASADKFIEQTVSQAKDETGWCKIRDLIVLPGVIRGGLWLLKETLARTAAGAGKA